ncbi:MAG: hypothetical protein J6C64_05435 [Lachnospiraceae bacterium]|nr:hypothetical protein [Lachnospiraceae bacterium]
MKKSDRMELIFEVLLLIGLVCFVIAIFIINLFHFNYRMNADIASDTILGSLIWESGQVIPDTWYVANEVRIICTPNVSALFYGLCHNMTLSMGLACCVMTVMILLSIFYFLKSIGIERKYRLIMEFTALMIPTGFIALELSYLFTSYYAVHIVALFFTLAVYGEYMKTERVKRIRAVCCILLAFILGVQGTRGILVIYGPLFGMEIIRNLYLFYIRQKKKKTDLLLSGWVILLLTVSFIGTCFPISVGQSFSRNIRKGFNKLFTVVVPDMGRAIGFEETHLPGKICLLLLLLASCCVLINILIRMVKKQIIRTEEWIYLIVCSSPVVTALIVAFTTVESSERYYFILLFAIAYGVMLWHMKSGFKARMASVGVICVLAVINFSEVYFPAISSQEPPVSDIEEAAEYLEEQGYTKAYATFENANTMTVLSGGAVRVAPVNSVSKMDICKWMTSTDWYVPGVPYEETTAYVITEAEMEEFKKLQEEYEDAFQYLIKIGKYYIYSADYNFSNLGQ